MGTELSDIGPAAICEQLLSRSAVAQEPFTSLETSLQIIAPCQDIARPPRPAPNTSRLKAPSGCGTSSTSCGTTSGRASPQRSPRPPRKAIARRMPSTPTARSGCTKSTGACASCASGSRAWPSSTSKPSWARRDPRARLFRRLGAARSSGRSARAGIGSSDRTSSTWRATTSAWTRRWAEPARQGAWTTRSRVELPGGAQLHRGRGQLRPSRTPVRARDRPGCS